MPRITNFPNNQCRTFVKKTKTKNKSVPNVELLTAKCGSVSLVPCVLGQL